MQRSRPTRGSWKDSTRAYVLTRGTVASISTEKLAEAARNDLVFEGGFIDPSIPRNPHEVDEESINRRTIS